MVRVVRPTLAKLVTARMQEGSRGVTARGAVVVGAATIASALATDLMGLHFIIGAFLVGATMPANLHKPILDRLQVMTLALLLPFFFTLTGMRMELWPKVGEGVNRGRRHIVGVFEPPLLHRRSDMPCPTIML